MLGDDRSVELITSSAGRGRTTPLRCRPGLPTRTREVVMAARFPAMAGWLILCGIASGLVVTAARADEAEENAVAAVERLGGKVYRTPDPKRRGAKLVTGVWLSNTKAADDDLK